MRTVAINKLIGGVHHLLKEYQHEKIFRLYKRSLEEDEESKWKERLPFDINIYSEFVGIFFSHQADETIGIFDSNLRDIHSRHTLYTKSDLDFEIDDLISEGTVTDPDKTFFYEIISIDGSIGYKTIKFKGFRFGNV